MHIETLGSGPSLVLLHGWALHGGVFAPLVQRLSDRYTLHLVDLPGHGHSRHSDVALTVEATVGAIRGAGRLEYVAVGTPVNLAARLCSRAADGEVLADDRTQAALLPDDAISATAREPEQLKGFPDPVPVYAFTPPSEAVAPVAEAETPWWQWWRSGAKRKTKRRRRKRSKS